MNETELEDYLETHYEVVCNLENTLQMEELQSVDFPLKSYYNEHGMGGMWMLAKSITDDFQTLHRGREWDGEWLDELEKYIDLRINQL